MQAPLFNLMEGIYSKKGTHCISIIMCSIPVRSIEIFFALYKFTYGINVKAADSAHLKSLMVVIKVPQNTLNANYLLKVS